MFQTHLFDSSIDAIQVGNLMRRKLGSGNMSGTPDRTVARRARVGRLQRVCCWLGSYKSSRSVACTNSALFRKDRL